jgi:hypothetical protein
MVDQDISGSHSGVADVSSFLHCYAVSTGPSAKRTAFISSVRVHLLGELNPEDQGITVLRNVANY